MAKNGKREHHVRAVTKVIRQDADGKFKCSLPSRTMTSDDGETVMTYIGALRKAVEGATIIREDLRAFLEHTASWPEELAVIVDKEHGPRAVCDGEGRPLGWTEASE